MNHKRLTGLIIAVALSAGCGSCRSEDEVCVPTIRIESPENEALILLDMDEAPDMAGVQITVEATVSSCVADGSSASLVVNDDSNRARSAFTQDGSVVFEAVTLVPLDEDGKVKLTASVRELRSGHLARDTIHVWLDEIPAVDCSFVSPVDGAVLGPEDDVRPGEPGLHYDVAIQCLQDLDGTPAGLTVDGAVVPTAFFVEDMVTFPAVRFSEGVNVLEGTFTTEAGAWSDQILVSVDTPACEVRFSPSGDLVFNLDGDPPRVPDRTAIADADGDPTSGIQADFTMPAADCLGGRAALLVDGEEVAWAMVGEDEVSFDRITLPDGEDVEVYVEVAPVEGERPYGRSREFSFWVDSIRPSPVLLWPHEGEILRADADKDGDPSNGIQIDVYIEAPDLESFHDPSVPWRAALIEAHLTRTDAGGGGETQTLSCLVGIDDCRDPANPSRYRIEADLDLVADYALEVVITDPAGNVGREEPIEFSVDARPVTISIASPEEGTMVNLGYAGVDGTLVPVVVEGDSPEVVGAEVRVSCTGAVTATGTFGVDEVAVAMVDFSNAPCDGHTTTCTAHVTVDSAQYQSEPVGFSVDLEPPTLEIVAPYDGSFVYEPDVTIEVIAGCLEDGQQVSVRAEDGSVLGESQAIGGAAMISLTLAGGPHTITATALDAAGNLGESDPVSFTVAGEPPVVMFIAPTDGMILFDEDDVEPETPGFQYDVLVQVANEPEGTPVTLQIGYDDAGTPVWRAPLATAYTEGAGLRARFDVVTLPEGDVGLRAVATGQHGLRGEATVWPRVSTGAIVCNIVSPVDGAAIGPAHDPEATADTGVRHDVRVQTDLDDDSDVVLTLTRADGSDDVLTAVVSEGQATFAEVVFTTAPGEEHGLNVLDAACGADGQAMTTEVLVDLEAPVSEILMPQDGEIFNASSTDASAQGGFQIHFRAVATNPSTGESVTAGASGVLTVDCGLGDPDVYPVTFATYGEEIQARARPTLEDQSTCDLSFVVTDEAGNTSEVVSATVVVDRVPPEVELLSPADGRWFGIVDDRQEFVDGFQQNVEVAYSGLANDDPVRVFFQRESEAWVEVEADVSPHLVTSGTQAGYTFVNATYTMAAIDEVVVRVVAEDAAGNTAVDMVTVNIDTEAPQVAITRPEPGAACVNLLTDFNKDEPGVHTQVNVETVGVVDGLPLSLCGTNRDDGGDACSLGGFTGIMTSTVTANVAAFPAVRLMDGEQELMAEVRDLAGNFSRSEPVTVCADSIPPEVTSFEVPADLNGDGYINAEEHAAAGGTICFEFEVEGAEGQRLSVYTSNPSAGTLVGREYVEAGEVTVCGTLAEGSHALEAHVRDENNNPNLWPSNPVIENPEALRPLVIDTIPPTMSIASPPEVVNAEVAGAENIDPEVEFRVSSNAEGREVSFEVDGQPAGQATVSSGSASVQVTLTNGMTHTLRAEVSDAAGNVTERTREVTVDTTPPQVEIIEPETGAQLNNNTVAMTVDVSLAEEGRPLRVYRTDVSPETLLRDTTVSATQPQSFNVSLPDGTATMVARAWDAAGNMGESAAVSIEIDTEGCSLVWVEPTGSPVVFNLLDDEDEATPGLQKTIIAETVDCGGLDVELLKGTDETPVDTQTASASTGQVSFAVSLDDGESGSFTARIEDGFGNVTDATFEFSVDITPPGLVKLYPDADALAYVTDENPTVGDTVGGFLRLADKTSGAPARADFSFEATGADGGSFRLLLDGTTVHGPVSITTDPRTVSIEDLELAQKTDGILEARVTDSAGNVTSLELQVKVDVIAPAAPAVSLEIVDNRRATVDVTWTAVGDDGLDGVAEEIEVRWATSEITGEGTYADANIGAMVAGDVLEETLTPLPPLNTYWIAVRARDALGNVSPLVEGTNLVSLENMWNEVVLEGDDGGFFGFNMVPVGVDLNYDGYDDLIVGAGLEAAGGTQRGAVYVYYGGPDPTSLTRQKLMGEQNGERFGLGLASGDVTGNGTADVIVGAEGYSTSENDPNRGRAFLYFGDPGGGQLDESERVEFRGIYGAEGRFGRPISLLGDVNGNGFVDIAIAARAEGANDEGRVYVFFGREKADWEMLAAEDGYVSAVAADLVLAGVEPGGEFGHWNGNVGIGPLGSDTKGSFVIPASAASRAYVFKASEVLAAVESPILASDAFQVLEGEGRFAFAGFMGLLDGSERHLVLSDENAAPNRVYIYGVDSSGVNDECPVQVLERSGARFGYSLAYGDITGDGLLDLLVGTNSATLSSFFLFINTGGVQPFSVTPDSSISREGHLGVSLWVGDVNGDGSLDVAAGSSSNARVHLFY